MIEHCRRPECADKPPRFIETKQEMIYDEVRQDGEFIQEDNAKTHDAGHFSCFYCDTPLEWEWEGDYDEDPRAMGLNNG